LLYDQCENSVSLKKFDFLAEMKNLIKDPKNGSKDYKRHVYSKLSNIDFHNLPACYRACKLSKSLLILLLMGYCKKGGKNITDVKISTCPASKTTCQDDRTSGIFMPCITICIPSGDSSSVITPAATLWANSKLTSSPHLALCNNL